MLNLIPVAVPRRVAGPRREREELLEHGLLLEVEAVVHHLVRDPRPEDFHGRLFLLVLFVLRCSIFV